MSGFTIANDRLAKIRIREKFYNSTFFCAKAPTDDKNGVIYNNFFVEPKEIYDKWPAHDDKIVLGNFKVKVGQEGIFGSSVGQLSVLFHCLQCHETDKFYRSV